MCTANQSRETKTQLCNNTKKKGFLLSGPFFFFHAAYSCASSNQNSIKISPDAISEHFPMTSVRVISLQKSDNFLFFY